MTEAATVRGWLDLWRADEVLDLADAINQIAADRSALALSLQELRSQVSQANSAADQRRATDLQAARQDTSGQLAMWRAQLSQMIYEAQSSADQARNELVALRDSNSQRRAAAYVAAQQLRVDRADELTADSVILGANYSFAQLAAITATTQRDTNWSHFVTYLASSPLVGWRHAPPEPEARPARDILTARSFGMTCMGDTGCEALWRIKGQESLETATDVAEGFETLASFAPGWSFILALFQSTTGQTLMTNRRLSGVERFFATFQVATSVGGPMVAGAASWLDDAGRAAKNAEGAIGTLDEVVEAVERVAPKGELAGSIRTVNPNFPARGFRLNCVECVIATEKRFAGAAGTNARSSAGPLPISRIIDEFGGAFEDVSGMMDIGRRLSQSGDGARGIVYGADRARGFGHVWNVRIDNGVVRFLDSQAGSRAGLGVHNFDSFTDLKFLLTAPGGQ